MNNLLEIGSTIKSIKRDGLEKPVIETVESVDDWFRNKSTEEDDDEDVPIEKVFCFGCKRMCIETKPESREAFVKNLP